MVNTKGGFLVEEGNNVDEDELRKKRERERQRLMQNVEPRENIARRSSKVKLTVFQR